MYNQGPNLPMFMKICPSMKLFIHEHICPSMKIYSSMNIQYNVEEKDRLESYWNINDEHMGNRELNICSFMTCVHL